MKKISIATIASVVLGLAVWLVLSECREETRPAEAVPSVDAASSPRQNRVVLPHVDAASSPRQPDDETSSPKGRGEVAASTMDAGENAPAKTPEELKEEAEEAAVDSFDNLTDKWMEPSEKGVTMTDVDAFVAQFKKVPKDRQEECLQRALNLVPDENVMLLAGVLMDKSQPKELVELVFNDILNRDEDVKKPILQQVFKDKTHPCWADTAWIFDVTGEASASKTDH